MVTPILRFALPSSERDRPAVAVAAVVKRDKRSMRASSEESMGSWSQITPEDDPHEETSSFIQLSEGSVTVAPWYCSKRCYSHPHPTPIGPLLLTLVLSCANANLLPAAAISTPAEAVYGRELTPESPLHSSHTGQDPAYTPGTTTCSSRLWCYRDLTSHIESLYFKTFATPFLASSVFICFSQLWLFQLLPNSLE